MSESAGGVVREWSKATLTAKQHAAESHAVLKLVLSRHPLFARLEPVTVLALLAVMRRLVLNAGEELFRAGADAAGLLVIEKCVRAPPRNERHSSSSRKGTL